MWIATLMLVANISFADPKIGGVEVVSTQTYTNGLNTKADVVAGAVTNPIVTPLISTAELDVSTMILTNALGVVSGGTGLTNITAGYLIVGNGTNPPTLLAPGSEGTVLKIVSGVPAYATDATGAGSSAGTNQESMQITNTVRFNRHDLVYVGGTNVIVDCSKGNRFRLQILTNTFITFTNVLDNSDVIVNVEQPSNNVFSVFINPAQNVRTNLQNALNITSGTNTASQIQGWPDGTGTNLFLTVNTNLLPIIPTFGLASGGGSSGGGGAFSTNIVQGVAFAISQNNDLPSNGERFWNLPNTTQASNCIVVFAQSGDLSGWNFSVSDDQTNTYTMVTNRLDAGNGQRAFVFVAPNIRAGARNIRLKNLTPTGLPWISGYICEISGIAATSPVDVHTGNNGTSATLTAGSFTPTVTDDVILQFAVKDSGTGPTNYAHGSQSNIGWSLLTADDQDAQVVQWGIYHSTAALNPSITASLSHSFISIAVALKTAAVGNSRPTGMQIVNHYHQSQDINGPLVQLLQFPTVGNLPLIAFSSGSTNYAITNVTDSVGNTWTQASGGENHNATVEETQWWYAVGATPHSNNIVTVKYRARTGGHGTIMFYDIAGVTNGSPFDVRVSQVGTQTVAGNLTAPGTLTPAQAGGLVFAQEQHALSTTTNITGTAGLLFDSDYYNNIPISGPQNVDQNGGWAHFRPVNTSAITFTWKFLTNNLAIDTWAADAISFKP